MPSKSLVISVQVNSRENDVEEKLLYSLLFGVDQLSVVRYQGSKTIRRCLSNSVQRLEGLYPVAEDWHTEVVVLKVSIYTLNITALKCLSIL